jgi:hypothetical protein
MKKNNVWNLFKFLSKTWPKKAKAEIFLKREMNDKKFGKFTHTWRAWDHSEIALLMEKDRLNYVVTTVGNYFDYFGPIKKTLVVEW